VHKQRRCETREDLHRGGGCDQDMNLVFQTRPIHIGRLQDERGKSVSNLMLQGFPRKVYNQSGCQEISCF
jgi:hypothetical protein